MKTIYMLVALTIAAIGAGPVAAQDVIPGTRVRIFDPGMDRPVVGTVVALTADSAVIQGSDRAGPVRVRLEGARIERSRGRSGHAVEGGLILGLAGVAFGMYAEYVTDEIAGAFGGEAEGGGGIVFVCAGAGAAAGALIGSLIRTESWDRVTIRPTAPAGGGVGLAIAIPAR